LFNISTINKALLILIISVSAILRLYNYSSFSITADEVSAINRAQFSTFNELIENGVCKDTHPAGVQVFLFYWIKAFGISEAAVRFPFVIAGILSVLLIYLIAKRWFNETVALLSAAAIGFLQFPIVYSQLARPYSPGLLFSLSTVLFWTKFIFDGQHKNKLVFIGFVFSVALAMYTHYFSALFVVMVSFTGLFFINKENYKQYLLTGFCVLLLFLPHYKIFLIQFKMGGVGGADGWLGKPTPGFIVEYLKYCFNNSKIVYSLFLFLFALGIISAFRNLHWKKFHSLCLIWFFTPYIIGYFYSAYVNPLLQNSILLFSFPFIVIFLLSFLNNVIKPVSQLVIVLTFSSTIVYSTVCEKHFYSTQRFGVLKELANDILSGNEKYGDKNITRTINLIGPYSIHYYFSQQNKKPLFKTYMNNGNRELSDFSAIIDSATTPYFIYAWSTRYSPPEIPEMIEEKFPILLEKKWYYNSEYYLFSTKGKSINERWLFLSRAGFEKKEENWNMNEKFLQDSIVAKGKFAVEMDSTIEYGPTFRGNVKNMFKSTSDILNINLFGRITSMNDDAQLVVSFEREGKSYDWHSNSFSFFIKKENQWGKIFLSLRLPEQISEEDEVVVYVWNNSKRTIFIDEMEIGVKEGNPLVYGKRKEF
jgi:hypothetical protein